MVLVYYTASAYLGYILATKHIVVHDLQARREKNGGVTFARSVTSLAESLTVDRQDP
jgi:hypothetical protein